MIIEGYVLAIDDKISYLKVIKHRLTTECNYAVVTLSDIVKANKYIEKRKNKIGAILLDIVFDENDEENKEGIELLKIIKERYPILQVIILSEKDRESAQYKEAIKLGPFGYYNKSSDFDELKLLIRNAINTKTLLANYYDIKKKNHELCVDLPKDLQEIASEIRQNFFDILNKISIDFRIENFLFITKDLQDSFINEINKFATLIEKIEKQNLYSS